MYGDKSRCSDTVKLYRISQEPFVLVHDLDDNDEYIYKIQEDGLLQDGICRYKFPDGDTQIGCRLFRRGDRQEDKKFRLLKFGSSGEIRYIEHIFCNPDYKFHPETMSWSKLE